MWKIRKLPTVLVVIQVVLIIIYALLVDYDAEADGSTRNFNEPANNILKDYYPMFQDVQVMIFMGFGFLMTFLKMYGFSAVGINMLLAVLAIQWAIIMQGVWAIKGGKIKISVKNIISGEFASAATLISYGALLGKTSPLQLITMTILEIAIFACNEHLGVEVYNVADVGGSIFIHLFGAYFGLAVCYVLYRAETHGHDKEESVYHSDLFAMIGTVFLWMFWPSFNGALAALGTDRHRVVINTFLSLAVCSAVTFAISALVDGKGRLNMVHIQNATLAGGVAIGTSANLMVEPYGAMLVGGLAGLLSTLGYHFLTPLLSQRWHVHDTCGVNNLHGMPGIFAGLVGVIMAHLANEDTYGYGLYEIYPARAPPENSTDLVIIQQTFPGLEPGCNRTAETQALYQLAAVGTTLLVAVAGGIVTGMIMKLPLLEPPSDDDLFDDKVTWIVPEEESIIQVIPTITQAITENK